MDEAEHGAILFSLGSNIKSTDVDDKTVSMLLTAFGKLKERVLWKWDAELFNVPDNVFVTNWLPQTDLLAHKNMKLFISHCGLGGVYEAKSHGVPILAMPFFADQPGNAQAVVQEGWGTLYHFNDMTEETLTVALDEILNNATYRNMAQRVSQLYRDRPVAPLDLAVYWIEYVIRYGGAKHMQSPGVHMNFFELHSIDAIAFIAAVLFVAYIIVALGIKAIRRIVGSFSDIKIKVKRA